MLGKSLLPHWPTPPVLKYSKLKMDRNVAQNLMPHPSTGPKLLWAGPKCLCQTKNLYIFCASQKHLVPHQ